MQTGAACRLKKPEAKLLITSRIFTVKAVLLTLRQGRPNEKGDS